jgi:hypothetical protein
MRLRFSFDAGSGICLWAMDTEAKARFGYPVEAAMLGVPEELRAEIEQLVADYDDTFPWDDPASGQPVAHPGRLVAGYDETPAFASRVRALLPRLRAALGPAFEIESDYER